MKLIDLIETTQLNEAIYGITAGKTRSRLLNYARKHIDSADIQPLSNFESYEDQPHISLKLSIYGCNPKKVKNMRNLLGSRLEKEGWAKASDDDTTIYRMNDLFIKFHPINKVYRSSPYKNRETHHQGIEVIGAKYSKKKS